MKTPPAPNLVAAQAALDQQWEALADSVDAAGPEFQLALWMMFDRKDARRALASLVRNGHRSVVDLVATLAVTALSEASVRGQRRKMEAK